MDEYANSLKETLTSLIREMAAAPAPYVKNPEKDFTRKKKLPFDTVMQLL
ncbi:IS4/IS5 family transposase, partial [Paenibacillus mesophilus]